MPQLHFGLCQLPPRKTPLTNVLSIVAPPLVAAGKPNAPVSFSPGVVEEQLVVAEWAWKGNRWIAYAVRASRSRYPDWETRGAPIEVTMATRSLYRVLSVLAVSV
jgi:hypothetical protein